MRLLRTQLFRSRLLVRQLAVRGYATESTRAERYQATGNKVKIVEVGPRDGLQNEKKAIPLETKLELIKRLAQTGLTGIEAGSFVAPKWVPQMANSAEIMENLLKNQPASLKPITYSFLAPNVKGFDNAMSLLHKYSAQDQAPPTPPDSRTFDQSTASNTSSGRPQSVTSSLPNIEISVFAAATESFSQKNLNCSIEESLERFQPVIQGARAAGIRVRAYISVVLGCPFEGTDIDPVKVAEIATSLLEMGADEIDLGDTTGMGTAPRTSKLLQAMVAAGVRTEDIAMHFHDTYGQALVNTAVSLEHGIRTFDSSVGGLGGCPYSPGATGNVATEDMIYFLDSLGMETGVDLDAVTDIGQWITSEIGKGNASSVGKAILGKRAV